MRVTGRIAMSAGMIFLALACAEVAEEAGATKEEVKLDTEDQKAIYAIGVAMANMVEQQVANFELTPEERTLFFAGLEEQFVDNAPRVDLDTFGEQVEAFARTRLEAVQEAKMTPEERQARADEKERMVAALAEEQVASAAFVAEIAAKDGAVTTDSGLIYVEVSAGEGESPTAASQVKVHYEGKLRDGTVFDSSIQRGEPVVFPLAGVIPCWTEALQLMKPGGKAEIACPSDIAYGDSGRPPRIPGGATLVFDVELIEVVAATE